MHIFISHAAANRVLARALADALESAPEGVTTFVASRPGDIRADEDWLTGIERALQQADAYIIVLTPESILRPWVNFESGAAWFSRRQFLFVRIRALEPDEIPLPIRSRQIYCLDEDDEFLAVLQALGLTVANRHEWVAQFAQHAAEAEPVGRNEAAWEGIELAGQCYAWAGPLLDLEDRNEVPPPQGLVAEIERRGLIPRWVNLNNLPHHVERGLAQVFATDKRTWRRAVANRRQLLMVRNPHVHGDAA